MCHVAVGRRFPNHLALGWKGFIVAGLLLETNTMGSFIRISCLGLDLNLTFQCIGLLFIQTVLILYYCTVEYTTVLILVTY